MSQLHPAHYSLHIEPDLNQFRFSVRTEILFEPADSVKEIVLNALDLTVRNCGAECGDVFEDCTFVLEPENETLRIVLPRVMSGQIRVWVVCDGQINDLMAGFYQSRYVHNGHSKVLAVTQFQESDARRAFPCCDHPAYKASFDIEIDVEPGFSAVSNAAIAQITPLENGRRRFIFERTPRMSTYLVFFGVADFQYVRKADSERVRVITMPGMTSFADFGLDFGGNALEYCEQYYGIAYPFSKLDLIAIPDFAFGAMENWGAITFRENLLLCYPGVTSTSGKGRICEIIAHETVHQWFGNLVTPSDWKYLWLNESFATYFGYGIVDHYHPEWGIWDQFLLGQTADAMRRDALHENFPIEIPGGEHVVINASTAPIIYSKGGSILRQIHGYIGDDHFRRGLQNYLKTHAYACTSSSQLWEAFESVSDLPVSRIMKSWISQPGFPLLEVHRDGQALTITQKRFTSLPAHFEQVWVAPVIIDTFSETGEMIRLTLLLENELQTVHLPESTAAYKVNAGQTGFYRVRYLDAANMTALSSKIRNKTLSQEDRWGLHSDYAALLERGDVTLTDYRNFLGDYTQEDAFLPLSSISGSLYELWLIMNDPNGVHAVSDQIAGQAVSFWETILERIGYEPQAGEAHTTAILRDQILWPAALLGSRTAGDWGCQQFRKLKTGTPVNPDILKSVMQIGAFFEGDAALEWFDSRFRQSASEHERLNILTALGCFSEKPVIEKALDYVLDQVPARNQFIPVVSMSFNPNAVPLLWNWYTSHLDRLEQFHPLLYERILTALISSSGIHRPDEVRNFFNAYMLKSEKAGDAIRLALERLEIRLRMRRAEGISAL